VKDWRLLPEIIDAHHHYIPAAIVDDLATYLPPYLRVERDGGLLRIFRDGAQHMTINRECYTSHERQLRDMDAAGIGTSILSASVYQEWMTMKAARVFNRDMAEVQAKYPRRFVGLAHVPPFGEEGALNELERAVREYGLRGVCITTSFNAKYPDAREYVPFYRKVSELDVPIFVHAAGAPVDTPILSDYELCRTLGRGLEHALVVARILYSGVLEEFPKLRFLMGHLGGAFFAMTKRLVVSTKGIFQGIPQRDYPRLMQQIWYDTAPSFWQSPAEIRCAIETLGVDRILLGSDYPAQSPPDATLTEAVTNVAGVGLRESDLRKVQYETARRLFGL